MKLKLFVQGEIIIDAFNEESENLISSMAKSKSVNLKDSIDDVLDLCTVDISNLNVLEPHEIDDYTVSLIDDYGNILIQNN